MLHWTESLGEKPPNTPPKSDNDDNDPVDYDPSQHKTGGS